MKIQKAEGTGEVNRIYPESSIDHKVNAESTRHTSWTIASGLFWVTLLGFYQGIILLLGFTYVNDLTTSFRAPRHVDLLMVVLCLPLSVF